MKIKILLVPFIISIAVIISIWFIYPAYSNGSDGVKEKYAQLNAENGKIADLEGKSGNVSLLVAQLEGLSSDKDVLYNFLPKDSKEEKIFNDVSFLASNSGLATYKISIIQPKDVAVRGSSLEGSSAGSLQARNLRTEIKLSGSYEKIKEFLTAMEKLSRHNNCSSLAIEKNFSENGEESNPDVLTASVVADFDVLSEITISSSNVDDDVFSKTQMDLGIIDQIKNSKNSNVSQLKVDQKGKTNPFSL